jgi:hypothetical protein
MKFTLVLPVIALAALGAPGLRPAQPICRGLSRASSPLPFSDYVWLDSLDGPTDTAYDPPVAVLGAAMLRASQPAPGTKLNVGLYKNGHLSSMETSTFDLAAGDSVRITWSYWLEETAWYKVRVAVADTQPTKSSSVTWRFKVGPMPDGIVFERAFAPPDTIDTLTDFYAMVGIHNYTGRLDSGTLYVSLSDTDRVVHAESFAIEPEPDLSSYYVLDIPRLRTTGPHHGIMHFWTYGGSTDTLEWEFWVGPPLGVQDRIARQLAEQSLPATMLRALPPGACAFDAMGRRATNLKPGVYFVRSTAAARPRKVLLVK